MPEYDRSRIRNIALIAPHGAGKTSLVEAMLYMHRATDKLGKVDDGSSSLYAIHKRGSLAVASGSGTGNLSHDFRLP